MDTFTYRLIKYSKYFNLIKKLLMFVVTSLVPFYYSSNIIVSFPGLLLSFFDIVFNFNFEPQKILLEKHCNIIRREISSNHIDCYSIDKKIKYTSFY